MSVDGRASGEGFPKMRAFAGHLFLHKIMDAYFSIQTPVSARGYKSSRNGNLCLRAAMPELNLSVKAHRVAHVFKAFAGLLYSNPSFQIQ